MAAPFADSVGIGYYQITCTPAPATLITSTSGHYRFRYHWGLCYRNEWRICYRPARISVRRIAQTAAIGYTPSSGISVKLLVCWFRFRSTETYHPVPSAKNKVCCPTFSSGSGRRVSTHNGRGSLVHQSESVVKTQGISRDTSDRSCYGVHCLSTLPLSKFPAY